MRTGELESDKTGEIATSSGTYGSYFKFCQRTSFAETGGPCDPAALSEDANSRRIENPIRPILQIQTDPKKSLRTNRNAWEGNRTPTPLAGLRILSLDPTKVIYDETLT